MAPHSSYPRTRLYVEESLSRGAAISLTAKHAHYLHSVLRQKPGDHVALFNGRDGEWRATLGQVSKSTVMLLIEERLRPQTEPVDLWLLCAPLKGGKTEWVVEKATELGVSRICPVVTRFTVADRINADRLASTAVEAAEQCERLDVPAIDPLTPLEKRLSDWPKGRRLLFADESGQSENADRLLPGLGKGAYGVLIGPEGGFSTPELELLRTLPYVSGLCLGPRILRADTAAVAALTLAQAFCGDWEGKPAFRN